MLNELVKMIVEGDIQPCGSLSLGVQRLGALVTDGHHLGVVGSLTVVDHAGAAVGAQNSDAYFFHERGSFLRIWMEYRQVWVSSIFSSHRKLLFK
ncbi:MAG: hypothetical protein J6D21_10900 [Clostridia bacterium]|nr:hypothetical protein [Clostridia bacterium]